MIEAYAFLAVFAVQILAVAILYSTRFNHYVRDWARDFGSERFTQLYPAAEYQRVAERFAKVFRTAHIIIAVIGAAVLGWQFSLLLESSWDARLAIRLPWMFFMLQMTSLMGLAVYAMVRHKALRPPMLIAGAAPESKRKAVLKRRGLFDFVSPFTVYLAVASYLGFVAYGIYLDVYVYHNTTLSKACISAITAVTAVHALNAFVIYQYLYGKNNSLMTQEGRAHVIGMTVKCCVYSGILITWFVSVFGTLGQPGLQEWRPAAMSVFALIAGLITLKGVTAPRRKPEAGEIGSSSEVAS
jgi:hypothetical protein